VVIWCHYSVVLSLRLEQVIRDEQYVLQIYPNDDNILPNYLISNVYVRTHDEKVMYRNLAREHLRDEIHHSARHHITFCMWE